MFYIAVPNMKDKQEGELRVMSHLQTDKNQYLLPSLGGIQVNFKFKPVLSQSAFKRVPD